MRGWREATQRAQVREATLRVGVGSNIEGGWREATDETEQRGVGRGRNTLEKKQH